MQANMSKSLLMLCCTRTEGALRHLPATIRRNIDSAILDLLLKLIELQSLFSIIIIMSFQKFTVKASSRFGELNEFSISVHAGLEHKNARIKTIWPTDIWSS